MMTLNLKSKRIAVGENRDELLKQLYLDSKLRMQVRTIIGRYGGNVQDAEDVFQDAIIILDRNISEGKYQQKSTIKTYFLAICRNTWLNKQRKNSKTIYTDNTTTIDGIEEQNPEKQVIAQEWMKLDEQTKKMLKTIVKQMSKRCQEVLKLQQMGYSMEQIKNEMGFEQKQSAKNHAYRCRNRLRALIEKNTTLLQLLKNKFV